MTGSRMDGTTPASVVSARRDVVTGGITFAAIIMLVANGSVTLPALFDAIGGGDGRGSAEMLGVAMLLNVALILFGWRRYRDLSREVIERTAAEKRVALLAYKDPLTGLRNRRALADAVCDLLAQAERGQKRVALMIIDLDHFKTINDLHGHHAGDRLICAAASAIQAALPPSSIIARLGGDEFAAAFLFDDGQPAVVDLVAREVVGALAQPFDIEGIHTHISGSLGIAHSSPDYATIESLLRCADIAMYAAKGLGRNRHAWFDASMERALRLRNTIEADMRAGIPLGQFVPYYEQQIDLERGTLHGFEVLARWNHPTRGLVAPDDFIAIAEETGMIGDLSMSVMAQAFVEARGWDPMLTLSVNISPAQLKDPWLSQKLVKLLVETGFPARRLEVEITESSLFENLPLAQSIVGSLKNQGIRLALDDFGTGYSSLAHLRALPFDRIKIDRSFVTSINQSAESAAIVDAITKLGSSLGLPVTAEGIETSAIEARLRDFGCHKGQGWLFGKPMAVEQVRTLLAARSLLPASREPRTELRRAG